MIITLLMQFKVGWHLRSFILMVCFSGCNSGVEFEVFWNDNRPIMVTQTKSKAMNPSIALPLFCKNFITTVVYLKNEIDNPAREKGQRMILLPPFGQETLLQNISNRWVRFETVFGKRWSYSRPHDGLRCYKNFLSNYYIICNYIFLIIIF